jgi:hypothetical protein
MLFVGDDWAARQVCERPANSRIEDDHGRLNARLLPMQGLNRARSQ